MRGIPNQESTLPGWMGNPLDGGVPLLGGWLGVLEHLIFQYQNFTVYFQNLAQLDLHLQGRGFNLGPASDPAVDSAASDPAE